MESIASVSLLHGIVIKAATKTVIREFCGGSFDKQTVKKIKNEAKSTLNELSVTLGNIRNGKEGKAAVPHLSLERIAQMKTALDLKTFRVTVSHDNTTASIERDCKEVYETKDLTISRELTETKDLQNASIVVESIILLLEIAGIAVPSDWEQVEKVIEYFKSYMKKDDYILEHINQIVNNRDKKLALIRSIYAFVCDLYATGDLWMIVKLMFGKMSWTVTILNAAKIAAYIGLMTATTGIVHIANLTLKFVKVGEFVVKLTNVKTLKEIRSKTA